LGLRGEPPLEQAGRGSLWSVGQEELQRAMLRVEVRRQELVLLPEQQDEGEELPP
jgi:hypothetical protein